MKKFIESPVIIAMSVIGIIDMSIQAATSGAVKPIRLILGAIFGHGG